VPRHQATVRGGHQLVLLEGSRELFPALIAAMDAAQHTVQLETYIFDFTGAGALVAEALVRAAQRGVHTQVVVDGLGTSPLGAAWRTRLEQAGVRWRVFSPVKLWGLLLPTRWRRLHRKLCVVDGSLAFCGGINILDDFHDPSYGTLTAPRFDFAVQVAGPLVAQIASTMDVLWQRLQAVRDLRQHALHDAVNTLLSPSSRHKLFATKFVASIAGNTSAVLVLRDNLRSRMRIEAAYLQAIAGAQREITIANAYFVPGFRLRKALVAAAQRGVRVRLLLQGRYEYFMQYYAARPVYGVLLGAGVEIFEYEPSFLHAKVAVVDGHWATVGSSNLDPLSLLLAREANVVVRDDAFAANLHGRLHRAIVQEGRQMDPAQYASRPWRQRAMEYLAMLVMRLLLRLSGKRY
jgi:cardiolipin synthase